jgi:hypothetical protein
MSSSGLLRKLDKYLAKRAGAADVLGLPEVFMDKVA